MCWKQYQCTMYYKGWNSSQSYLDEIIWRQITIFTWKINGGFTYDGNYYKFYFIPDLPPTLKLDCNALGKLGIFLDNKCRKIAWTFITLLHEE